MASVNTWAECPDCGYCEYLANEVRQCPKCGSKEIENYREYDEHGEQ